MADRPEIVPLMVRLPKALHEQLVSAARDEERSLNYMVVQSVKEKLRAERDCHTIRERPAPYGSD